MTIFAGAHIKSNPNGYPECNERTGRCGITHVNILRTLEAMYELQKSGTQQRYAECYGITDDFIIKDIFD